ncbi:MAG TPA: hypothetical protein VIJ22_12890 [Polyangiaceae bacterium]
MKKNGSKVMGIAVALVLGAMGTVAFAHSTGNERRNGVQCDALAKDPKYGANEAAWCHTCIDGAPKSCGATPADKNLCHYHPGDPAGTRCRPDNGKP